MALITCPDCNGPISSSAPTCPHCGRPNGPAVQVQTTQGALGKLLDPAANARSCLGVIGVIVFGFVLLLIAGALTR